MSEKEEDRRLLNSQKSPSSLSLKLLSTCNSSTADHPCIHQRQLSQAMKKIAQLEKELAEVKSQNELLQKGGENLRHCLEDGFDAFGIDMTKMTENEEERQHWLEGMANNH